MLTKNKSIFLIALFFSLISFVSAGIGDIGTAKQFDCMQLPQTCVSCTYNNVSSVQYPDKTYALKGSYAMSRVGSNYNLTFCNTEQLGTYAVSGDGDVNGLPTTWSYIFDVSPSGTITNPVQISIYILFLIFCLVVTFLSIRLVTNNKFENDKLEHAKLYQERKRSEVKFYLTLLKRKLWIVGVFGIYLSVLLFVSILSQIVYNLGLSDLFSIFSNVSIVLLWGLIPFTLFWIVYLILFFYNGVKETMKWQFGSIR